MFAPIENTTDVPSGENEPESAPTVPSTGTGAPPVTGTSASWSWSALASASTLLPSGEIESAVIVVVPSLWKMTCPSFPAAVPTERSPKFELSLYAICCDEPRTAGAAAGASVTAARTAAPAKAVRRPRIRTLT